MPHITVEYSANLESNVDPHRLISAVHEAALATGIFELGAVRTRAERRDVYAVADRDPDNAFVAVYARIAPGRDVETRRRLARALLEGIEATVADLCAQRGLAISVEILEIDDTAALRKNNLHARMKAKADAPTLAAARPPVKSAKKDPPKSSRSAPVKAGRKTPAKAGTTAGRKASAKAGKTTAVKTGRRPAVKSRRKERAK
jgi:5-carboxymethyl-2-hydroxymuconate isomerase